MIRRVLTVLAICAASAASLHADLKYTMRMAAHPSTVPAATPPNPLLTMLSSFVLGMIAPPGGLEMTVIVGEAGTRVEYSQAYTVVPAGGAMVMVPDGSVAVINPATKTYWKAARPGALGALGGGNPVVELRRTGEFASIAGVRAEHATLAVTVPLPLPPGMQMPGLPSDLAVSGEAWLSDAYRKYAAMGSGIGSLVQSLGLDRTSDTGFVMRSVMRSDLFGGQELEAVVTRIAEVTVPAETFRVPPDYTEVSPPAGPFSMATGR
jgi:hypothetical protein